MIYARTAELAHSGVALVANCVISGNTAPASAEHPRVAAFKAAYRRGEVNTADWLELLARWPVQKEE